MELFKRGGNKKGAADATKAESSKRTPQYSGLSLGKILWAEFLVITIITLLSAYSSYLIYAEQIDENRVERQQAIAERASAIFAAKLELLTSSIERTLNDDAIRRELNEIETGSTTPPAALQRRLREQLHLLIRQVVVTPDTSPDNELSPPLSYACLELPALKKPTLELHRFGSEDQHLDIAFPLSNNHTLLLSFNTMLARQWFQTIDSGESYLALQQQIGGSTPLIFEQRGDLRLAGADSTTTRAIPGTQFQVAVALPVAEPMTQVERILFFVNFGITLLLIAASILVTLITIRLILNKDLRTIASIIKRPSVNLHHILPVKLAELRGHADNIKQLLGIEQAEAETKESAEEQLQQEENDLPHLFKANIEVDVEPEVTEDSEPTDKESR